MRQDAFPLDPTGKRLEVTFATLILGRKTTSYLTNHNILGDKFPNLGIDPLLRDNGGLAKPHTFTHALLLGSPAIDTIPLEVCHANGKSVTITADQRGMKRPDGNESACDIGAYEYLDSST